MGNVVSKSGWAWQVRINSGEEEENRP